MGRAGAAARSEGGRRIPSSSSSSSSRGARTAAEAAAVGPPAVDDDDGARSVGQSVVHSEEEHLDPHGVSKPVGGLAIIVLQLLVRSPLQELSDDLDVATDSRPHEGCRSIISLLVTVCPRSQQGFGAFKMP